MAKSFLMFIGILLVVIGILGLIPSLGWFGDKSWLAWAEIVFGAMIVITSNTKEKE